MGREPARETAGVTTRLIVTYVRRHRGEPGVERLLALAGESRPAAVLEDEGTWSTYDQKIALFEAAAEVMDDPQVARRMGESLLESQLSGTLRLAVAALGSPQQVLRSIARANGKFSTSATMRCERATASHGVVTYHLHPGYTPSIHDCRYTQGLLTQATALFGLPPATISHPVCQVEGAEECCYELSWPRWRGLLDRLTGRGTSGVHSEADALREQVSDLQRAAADLVSSADLDDVLPRIATRASAAVRAQQYLIAVQLEGEGSPRIHSEGLLASEARQRGLDLLEGNGAPGEVAALVARVSSARHNYGYLAAYLPGDTGFLPAEQAQLDAYAALAAAALDAATALEQARRDGAVTRALLTLAHQLAGAKDETTVAQRVVQAVPSVTGAARASLLLWEEREARLKAVAVHGHAETREAALGLEIPLGSTPAVERMLQDPKVRIYRRPLPEDPWMEAALERFGAAVVVVAPIVVQSALAGVVFCSWLSDQEPPQLHPDQLAALASLGDHAAVALDNVRLLEQARHQATHDDLTGLANRALFRSQIEQALADHRRTGQAAAVCFLDIDGFKAVNDELGHAAGDELLIQAARRIEQCVRESDVVARLSGDEFGVLARDAGDALGAERVAAELVRALAAPFELAAGTGEVSVSAGVALLPEHGTTPEALLRRSDDAMYVAKRRRGTYRIAGAAHPDEVA